MIRWRPARVLTVVFLLASTLACGGRKGNHVPPPIRGPEGGEARSVDFVLDAVTREDESVRLADFRGKVVLVNYFATWCQPCFADVDAFNALMADPEVARDLTIIGIAVDLDRELVPHYVELTGMAYPAAYADEAMINGRTPFGEMRAIPASFLVDPGGRHVETFQGIAPIDYIKRRVGELKGGLRP